jgi:hypothetical protein
MVAHDDIGLTRPDIFGAGEVQPPRIYPAQIPPQPPHPARRSFMRGIAIEYPD